MSDQVELISALKKIAEETWSTEQRPVLLSSVPRLLEIGFPQLDYKTLLGGKSLKSMIKGTGESAGYKLIEHPIQKARVAFAPTTARYEFPADEGAEQRSVVRTSSGHQQVTVAFLKALASLPEHELEKITIPTSVIVKLFK